MALQRMGPSGREAIWKLEKGCLCATGRGSRRARGSVKRLSEKGPVADGDCI